MYLDKIVINKLNIIGYSFLKKSKLLKYPSNINEMCIYLNTIKDTINNKEFDGIFLASVLYNFVTSVEVRDRQVTSRVFEDIFSGLFGLKATDNNKRNNPSVPNSIKELDKLCNNEDWLISNDLSTNRREKADVIIDNYEISLKTIKGQIYDVNLNVIDSDWNSELNIGSLSYRSLFKGILTDYDLQILSDRKGGLGSGSQMRKYVLSKIDSSKHNIFYTRLKLFFEYVYQEDLYIVFKSNYKIIFYLIPNKSFITSICNTYKFHENQFEKLFYRYENNNLRISLKYLLYYLDLYKLDYYYIDFPLNDIVDDNRLVELENNLSEIIEKTFKVNLLNN